MVHEQLVTQREFAKIMRVTDSRVSALKREGKLVIKDGLVAVRQSKELIASSISNHTKRELLPEEREKVEKKTAEENAITAETLEELSERAEKFSKDVLSGKYVSLGQAAIIKENAIALKHMLDARAKSGELVSKRAVMDASFEAARRERNQWLNWPARIGPLLAADLAIDPDKLVTELAAYVHEMLSELGEPEIDLESAA